MVILKKCLRAMVQVVGLLGLVGIAGCKTCVIGDEVPMNGTAHQVPKAFLSATAGNDPRIDVETGGQTVSNKPKNESDVAVIASGDDIGGVKEVEIWVEETTWHGDGDYGTLTGPGLLGAPTAKTVFKPKTDNIACTKLMALYSFSPSSKLLAQGDHYRARIWAVARNFAGQETQTPAIELYW